MGMCSQYTYIQQHTCINVSLYSYACAHCYACDKASMHYAAAAAASVFIRRIDNLITSSSSGYYLYRGHELRTSIL